MHMNKDQFCKTINEIRQIRLFQERVDEEFRAYRDWANNGLFDFDFPTLETTLIRTLEIMFNDTDSQFISWWIYECDMGREEDEDFLTVTDFDGGKYIIRSEQDLYDFLIKGMGCD